MTLDIRAELEKAGAVLLDRHFVYTSGMHGSGYINMDPLFPKVKLMQGICAGLARPFVDIPVDTVAAPATGGIMLSVLTALASDHWATGTPDAIWADKSGADFVFERAGFAERVRDKRVLVVEDLLNTGGSVAKVCHEVELLGGEVVGVSVICNRGGLNAGNLGVPRLESLLDVSLEVTPKSSCPLCAAGVPIVTDIGHGADFEKEFPDYHGGYYAVLN